MFRQIALTVALCGLFALVLLVGVPGLHAQNPEDAPPSTPAVTTNSKVPFQGVLQENGQNVTGNREMGFTFYTDADCITSVGTTYTETVTVQDGLFHVGIAMDESLFTGQALWLEPSVGGQSLGCYELLPAPYAFGLVPGAEMDASLEGDSILRALNRAETGKTRALYGKIYSTSEDAAGVYGHAGAISGETFGIYGKNDSATSGAAGVYGTSTYTGTEGKVYGLYGYVNAANGRAVQAVNDALTGQARAVYAKNYSEDGGQAVYGHAGGMTGENYGVYGKSDSATSGAAGVYGTSTYTGTEGKVYGLYGYVNAANGRAVQAVNDALTGQARAVYAKSMSVDGQAVYGHAGATSGENYGIYGKSDSPEGYGGYFTNTAGGTAGYFEGAVEVSGPLNSTMNTVEMVATDYSTDPIVHAGVNAPQPVNMYTGRVTLDTNGEATVTLPPYFEALNMDYTYQLTPIGGAAPNLHIASEVSNNAFTIAGGTADLVVSWQVTGVRR